jgi:hypothetical protein
MTEEVTGGCQCGAVRYRASIDDHDAYLCHCRMCQRATGGVSIAFKQVRVADLAWDREPDRYRSSPFAQRGFCRACGTPLTYESDGENMLDLTVGSFDAPELFSPTAHFGVERWHPAWLDTSGLPTARTQDNERISNLWKAHLGHVP